MSLETETRTGWGALLAEGRLPRFALLCLGIWLNAADTLVTATIMPSVAADIGGYAYFGWAVATFMLGAIVAGASAGHITNLWGLRRAMLAGAFAYAAGCVLSAASFHVLPFLAGRLLQGVGAGWIAGLCYVAISMVFPQALWARLFAAISGVWGVATILGPLVGGFFAGAGLWRDAFWMFAIQGLIFAAVSAKLLPRISAPAPQGLAIRQLAMLAAAITAIAAGGLVEGAALALVLVVGGVALLAAMVWLDSRMEPRLLPRSAADLRSVAGSAYFVMFALAASAVVFSVYGAALLQVLYGLSPLAAGYALGAEAIGWTISSLVVGGLSSRQQGLSIALGVAAIPIGLTALALAFPFGSLVLVIAAGTLVGVGFGISWSFMTRKLLASLPEEERAIGSSAAPAVQLTGNATGAAAAGALGNWLGLAHGFDPATALAASPWLFAAFVPLALLGGIAARPLIKAED